MAKELKELTKRADNYSQWFNDLVVKADMAELSKLTWPSSLPFADVW